MQTVTNRQLIKFLPIDEKVKMDILAKIDTFTADQNYELSKLCWTVFYELIDMETAYEFKKAILDASEGKRSLQNEMYKKIEEQVFQRFIRDLREEQEADLLEETRQKLQAMITRKISGATSSVPKN